jgi:hypothetical protein
MLLLEIDKLKPGMIAAAPVRHPQAREVELLLPGVRLELEMIRSLRRLGVAEVWVRWPDLDFLDAQVNLHISKLRHDVYGQLKSDFQAAQGLTVCIGQYVRYCDLISALAIELLADRQNGQGAFASALFDGSRDLFDHCANVCYLALTLGLRMEGYVISERRRLRATAADNLTNLGVGAMLHDVGKLQVPSTLSEHEPMEAPCSPAYREHPQRGCRMIHERVGATARCAVMHHHQRFDGTGFPDMSTVSRKRSGPLSGCGIHIFPRIVAVCDAFDNLCHDAHGRPRPLVAALHEIQGDALAGRFDPAVLRGLLRHVPPFGLGTQVMLNDRHLAAVVGLNAAQPCRPVVRLLRKSKGHLTDIDLAKRRDLWIAQAQGMNVEQWYYELPSEVKVAAG